MRPIELDGLVTKGDSLAWALFSPCGRYRYALGRMWDEPDGMVSRPVFCVTCLNPSTADHLKDHDDPTLRKLIHYGKQEGCGALLLRNVGAFRTTYPRELRAAGDPVGPRNIEVLRLDPMLSLRVAAWGRPVSAKLHRRFAESRWAAGCSRVFGLTKGGHPKHPLYLTNATRVTKWVPQ